jgi:hypothetical protein
MFKMSKAPLVLGLIFALFSFGREAKLTRYPSYYQGRVAFSYMGDIWTADDNGQNIQRLTVHSARDIYPRFSPDGKWIAFSSDRNGNLDVFIIPAKGGEAKQLTYHSADDNVLGWTPALPNKARLPQIKGLIYMTPLPLRWPLDTDSRASRPSGIGRSCTLDHGPYPLQFGQPYLPHSASNLYPQNSQARNTGLSTGPNLSALARAPIAPCSTDSLCFDEPLRALTPVRRPKDKSFRSAILLFPSNPEPFGRSL